MKKPDGVWYRNLHKPEPVALHHHCVREYMKREHSGQENG